MKIKKLTLLSSVFSAIFLAILLHSCQEEEMDYSCDQAINSQIKAHLHDYEGMSRAEWLLLPDSLKIPAYRAFSAKQKELFWKQKHEELKAFFNDDLLAKNHISHLFEYIDSHPGFFENGYMENNENQKEFERFIHRWNKYALLDLGWEPILLYAVSATGNKLTMDMLANRHGIEIGFTGGDCACSSLSDWCDIFGDLLGTVGCRSHGCTTTRSGCGGLWMFSCDGICRG